MGRQLPASTRRISSQAEVIQKDDWRLNGLTKEVQRDLQEIIRIVNSLPKEKRIQAGWQALQAYFQDEDDFVQNLLWITSKKPGEIARLRYNAAQRRLSEAIKKQEDAGLPVRVIILKARQLGFSTWIQGKYFARVTRNANTYALSVGNKKSTTKNLNAMARRFMRYLFWPPGANEDSHWELSFDNDSRLATETARASEEMGRSHMAHLVHCSELAFWPDPEVGLTALLQVQGDKPGTWTLIESTANGVNNYFHQLWGDAIAGRSDFIPLFFPWFEDPEYSRRFAGKDAEERFEKSMTEKEKACQKRFKLTLKQMNWRRWCIRNKCRGSEAVFRQEYPACAEEAFLHSGSPVFDSSALEKLLQQAEEPRTFMMGMDPNETFVGQKT